MVLISAVSGQETVIREAWSRSYILQGDSVEIGSDIKVDSIKNSLYVTGLKCVKEGENTRGIVAVRKIDLEGNEVWKQVCDIGVGGIDESSTIAVDNKNNVYVAGYRYIKGKNLWLRKYDFGGSIIWDKTFENIYDSRDAQFKDIAVDAEGNVYAAGYKLLEDLSRDLWIGKYSPEGRELWKVVYSRGNVLKEDQSLVVDPEGNSCVALYEFGENASYVFTIKKYDRDGKVLMSKQVQADKLKNRKVNKIALDLAGNIYFVGSESVFYQGRNIFVMKLDASGAERWIKTYTNSGYENYAGNNIVVDKDSHIYVSATGGGSKDDKKYSWLSVLDKDGNELWIMNYSGYSYGVKFAVQKSGEIYVLGTEIVNNNNSNIWVKKYIPELKK